VCRKSKREDVLYKRWDWDLNKKKGGGGGGVIIMSFSLIRIKKGKQLLPSWKMMHELDVLQRASEGRQKFLVNLANEKQNFSSTQTEKEYGVE
jgi:hypothetical protein